MGLNMNYTLLTGEHSSKYHIPEYNSKLSHYVYSESFMMQALVEFNQEIRESKNMLSEICNKEYLNEGNISDAIFVGIADIIDKVITAVKRIKDIVFNAIDGLVKKIREFIANKKDQLEENHSFYQREQMLKKALSNTDKENKMVNIVDIKPSNDLMNDDFPDPSVLSDTRLHSDIEDLCIIERNTREFKDGLSANALDPEKAHVETLVAAIENDKERLLSATFGNRQYDITDIIGSAKKIADEAFGKADLIEAELSCDLYGQACDNIENLKMIADSLEKTKKEYLKEYNTIEDNLAKLKSGITKTLGNQNAKLDMPLKKQYYESAQMISTALKRGVNVIDSIVSANHTLFMHKAHMVNAIIDSSYKVKNLAHRLIRKNLSIEEENPESFNGAEQVQEFFNIQDDFNLTSIMISEAFAEDNYNDAFYSALLEAEGDNNQQQSSGDNNAQPATTEPATTGANNQPEAKSGSNIKTWLNNIIGKLGETFSRFKNRIDELIIKNGPDQEWWKKHKANIEKMNISDTKANDWYKFNFDALKNKNSFIEFDPTQEYMKSDEAMQNAIMQKISSNLPQFDEKDSFAQKINKIYQGGAPVSDKNSDGQTLQNLGYKHDDAVNYVNDVITKGFASDSLGAVSDDYKKLDTQKKNVDQRYSEYASNMKASNPQPAANNDTSNNNASEEKSTNESAIYDDFKFNLAEHFCLIHHEASFTVGQQTAQSAVENGAGESGNGSNKELDAMIKRYFNYNTIAITAKMTCAISAYKQYLSLFKAVYKTPKENNNNNNQATNNTNNQQQSENNNENK